MYAQTFLNIVHHRGSCCLFSSRHTRHKARHCSISGSHHADQTDFLPPLILRCRSKLVDSERNEPTSVPTLYFSSFVFPAIPLGFTISGEIFAYVTVFSPFKSNHHIPSSWMLNAACVFVAGIHPSRTRMSGSFESVQWNACVQRLDLGLYSYLSFGGIESEPMLTPRERIPSTGSSGGSNPRCFITQDSKPNTELFRPPCAHM